jgi:hypothetical protein
MLEKAEQNRHNVINNGDTFVEVNSGNILNNLTGVTSGSTLMEDKAIYKKVLSDIIGVTGETNSTSTLSLNVNYDWQFELVRGLIYPIVRPLFTPKVLFLLMLNKKIMGSLDEVSNIDTTDVVNKLMDSLFFIIKDIIKQIKDLLVDMFLTLILEKLKPLLELFASRMLLEALQMYKNLLLQIKECFILFGTKQYGTKGDDVNYADIIPEQIIPEQTIC